MNWISGLNSMWRQKNNFPQTICRSYFLPLPVQNSPSPETEENLLAAFFTASLPFLLFSNFSKVSCAPFCHITRVVWGWRQVPERSQEMGEYSMRNYIFLELGLVLHHLLGCTLGSFLASSLNRPISRLISTHKSPSRCTQWWHIMQWIHLPGEPGFELLVCNKQHPKPPCEFFNMMQPKERAFFELSKQGQGMRQQ